MPRPEKKPRLRSGRTGRPWVAGSLATVWVGNAIWVGLGSMLAGDPCGWVIGLLNGPVFALAVSAGLGGLVTYAGWYLVASWLSSLVVSGAWRRMELEGAPSFAPPEPRCRVCGQTHAGGLRGCFGAGPGQPETRAEAPKETVFEGTRVSGKP